MRVKRALGILVILILNSLLVVACGKKEEDYRQIQVYKIDGTATVARAGSNMDAYENMQLQSGDVVETVANSYLQLKLDEDKYILLEPDTKISLQATGNSTDSNTAIFLEKGAIVNQLDNPLSEDSSYQVTTPNSTMAVRGTTFRVEITYDEKGESFAKVAVYGGKVECKLVFPDGTIQEPVMVEGGTEVLVRGDNVESEYVMTGPTSYEELREKVLDFLEVAIERGEELSISKEEIEVLQEAKQAVEEGDATIEEVPEEDATEGENEADVADEDTEESEEPKEELKEEPKEETEEESEEEEPKEEETQQPTTTPSNPTTTPSNPSTGGGGTTSGGSTSQYEVEVKFLNADGLTFATKKVKVTNGEKSMSIGTIPLLKPETSGKWIYKYEVTSTDGETSDGEATDGETTEGGVAETVEEQMEVVANATLPITAGQKSVTIYWSKEQ